MKTILLSLIGVAAFAALSTSANAHDCDRPSYGYERSYYQPDPRVYYSAPPVYYRSYERAYYPPQVYVEPRHEDDRRCEEHHHHHGLHGLLEQLFR